MAKGQKRSGREPKKPKKSKIVTTSSAAPAFGSLRPQKPAPTPAKPADK
jgi:hypothetical protein